MAATPHSAPQKVVPAMITRASTTTTNARQMLTPLQRAALIAPLSSAPRNRRSATTTKSSATLRDAFHMDILLDRLGFVAARACPSPKWRLRRQRAPTALPSTAPKKAWPEPLVIILAMKDGTAGIPTACRTVMAILDEQVSPGVTPCAIVAPGVWDLCT